MIKKLILITLLTFGLSNELSTSVSVRTPNDDTKPLDYEYSIKVEDTNDKFQYLLKRDWERELGEKYIDDIAKFSHKVGTFYYGVDYVPIPKINLLLFLTYLYHIRHKPQY